MREKRYTETHEWISLNPDGKTCMSWSALVSPCETHSVRSVSNRDIGAGRIGISNYAAEALGDVVYIELPEKGDEVEQDGHFGSVESVKSASEIMSPVSGSVVSVNEGLVETPADLGKDPEGEGWLVEVETTDASAMESLMDAEAYAAFTKEEE